MIPDSAMAGMPIHNHLDASGYANVGQQIGAQFIEHNETIYHSSPDDSPDRMHAVARAHLDGGNPRQAEAILRTLRHNGHITTERAYFYVLSMLSDRSFTEITGELTDEIHHATSAVAAEPRDEWVDSLDVVNELLRYAYVESNEGTVDNELANALKMYGELSVDRQDEIATHLSRIVSGAEQEWLTAERKHQVATQRMSGDRIGRAWKFFEADPRPPGRWVTAPAPATAADWRDAVFGSAAIVSAVLIMLTGEITVGGVVGAALIVVGGYAAVCCTTVWRTHTRHAHSVWAHLQPQPYQQEGRFDRLVDQCFREGDPGGLWENTEGYRARLKRRLQEQYGDYDCHPFELQWLIRWHVFRVGQGIGYPAVRSDEAQRATNLRAVGVLVWVAVVSALLLVGEYGAFVLAVVGWWGISGIARLVSVSRVRRLLAQDAEVVFGDECAEHHRWCGELADRPSDVEMERWLAFDKAHLKNDALRRANLRERDLVTYVVLTERAPFARRSRITGGPPRYAAYVVYIFLLTKFGMRTTRTHLDLTTGDVRNQQHQMCTYDAVASASVMEKGVRTFRTDGSVSVGYRAGRVFRLVLLNGVCIAEVRENGRAIGDEQPGDVGDLEEDVPFMPSGGFDSALLVLEAVATEGRDWISRDRERRQRWARNWCTRPRSGDETGFAWNTGRVNR